MAEIHHFDHGWITPTVSYILSVLGSMLGLTCAIRLRAAATAGARTWWLVLAALSLGGTAIWSMHFVAMMGFKVMGTPIRYDIGLTAASALIAVLAVGLGLAIALLGVRAQNLRILAGGILAGLGVAAMHYTGMAAMEMNGDISYSVTRVGLSIAIAVVAATVALFLTVIVQKPLIVFVSAMVMGIAVNGMHFTGMTAMSVTTHAPDGDLTGATASGLIVPIGLAVVFGIIGLAYALMAAPTEEDRAAAAYLAARREGSVPPPAVPNQRTGSAAFQRPGPGVPPGPASGFQPAPRSGSAFPPGGSGPGSQPPAPSASGFPGPGAGGDGQGAAPDGSPRPGQRPPAPGDRPSSSLASGAWTYRDRSNNR